MHKIQCFHILPTVLLGNLECEGESIQLKFVPIDENQNILPLQMEASSNNLGIRNQVETNNWFTCGILLYTAS